MPFTLMGPLQRRRGLADKKKGGLFFASVLQSQFHLFFPKRLINNIVLHPLSQTFQSEGRLLLASPSPTPLCYIAGPLKKRIVPNGKKMTSGPLFLFGHQEYRKDLVTFPLTGADGPCNT